MKKKGFTLIELIAVLVILAILALIVTPLVMSIIKKARISADKRSIDAYGRSIELAIADYLMDTGSFPTSIGELTVEYSGDEVVCSTTQINTDSSVYLAGCTVDGRSVEGYTYGKEVPAPTPSYSVGDHVSYNGVTYYVIEDSDTTNDTVKLLKEEPLTVEEINNYGGVGTDNNHVNNYTYESEGTAINRNGYGGIQYYSSENCAAIAPMNSINSDCKTDYESSAIKYVVDVWANANFNEKELVNARLIDYEELTNFVEKKQICINTCHEYEFLKYDWLYDSNYNYYTETPDEIYNYYLKRVDQEGKITGDAVYSTYNVVRPVLELNKSASITKLAS